PANSGLSSRSFSSSPSRRVFDQLVGIFPLNLDDLPCSSAAFCAALIFLMVALSLFGISRTTEYFGSWSSLNENGSNRCAYERRTVPVITLVGCATAMVIPFLLRRNHPLLGSLRSQESPCHSRAQSQASPPTASWLSRPARAGASAHRRACPGRPRTSSSY